MPKQSFNWPQFWLTVLAWLFICAMIAGAMLLLSGCKKPLKPKPVPVKSCTCFPTLKDTVKAE